MFKLTLPQRIFFLIVTGILIILLSQQLPTSQNPPKQLTSPSPINSPTPLSVAPIPQPNCLADGDIQAILGKVYELQRENYLEGVQQLECSYQATETVKDVPVRMKYLLTRVADDQEWHALQENTIRQPGFHRYEGKENVIAVVNPVIEVRQTTLYAFQAPWLLEIYYAPVQENPSQMVEKTLKLSEEIFKKTSP